MFFLGFLDVCHNIQEIAESSLKWDSHFQHHTLSVDPMHPRKYFSPSRTNTLGSLASNRLCQCFCHVFSFCLLLDSLFLNERYLKLSCVITKVRHTVCWYIVHVWSQNNWKLGICIWTKNEMNSPIPTNSNHKSWNMKMLNFAHVEKHQQTTS